MPCRETEAKVLSRKKKWMVNVSLQQGPQKVVQEEVEAVAPVERPVKGSIWIELRGEPKRLKLCGLLGPGSRGKGG
jgi:hypothetical protein